MTRRIFSLLLALCLVVGLLPMAVFAEDPAEPAGPTASLVITTGNNDAKIQWKPTLSVGMAPAYAKTSAEGALVLEGTESDYNLKVEWPTEGTPTLTLNGATLANDTNSISTSNLAHTIVLGGTAAFEILLKGTNTINGALGIADTEIANHRMPAGIYAENKGSLTIKSIDKAADTLLIDVNGGNGILKRYNALTIDSADVTIQMENTAKNGQVAIAMITYGTAYADLTNLTVINSTLTVKNPGRYYGNNFILMGKDGTTYSAENTGDILFKNSTINMNRNNGTSSNSSGAETIKYNGTKATFTIDRCDFDIRGNHRTFNYAPTVVNCIDVQSKTSWSDWKDSTLVGGTALTSNTNNSGLKGTHVCGAEVDDNDCTTANTCGMCGNTVKADAHVPTEDDNDCTTALVCANPGCKYVFTPAAAAHTPAADDNDCTTAIVCTVCSKETTPAQEHKLSGDCTVGMTCGNAGCTYATTPCANHATAEDDGDCTTAVLCNNPGCTTVVTPAKEAHAPATDDGDCTTDIVCTNPGCKKVTTAGAEKHTGGTATCQAKAICSTCGKEYGELAEHTGGTATCTEQAICSVCSKPYGTFGHKPAADDGDCTTAVMCTACPEVAIEAKIHTYAKNSDTACANEGCQYVRTVTSSVVIATGNNTTATQWAPKIAEGMAPVYAKTTEAGLLVLEGSEKDYNLKIEWSVGGKPTLTLNNATLSNDTLYPNKKDTVVISGSADFVIQLIGTNVINGYPANAAEPDYKITAYRAAYGIMASNTGDLLICGTNKATDSLAIHSWGGHAIFRQDGSLTIENADFSIDVYKDATAGSYAAHGILLMYKDAAYADKTDLTVRSSNFKIDMHKNYAAYGILVGTGEKVDATNTSDILFYHSTVYFNRNNSTGQKAAMLQYGAETTVTFDRCDMTTCYAWRVVFAYVPTVINYKEAKYTQESDSKSYAYDPALAGTALNIRELKLTHECLGGEPVYRKGEGECASKEETLYFCIICGEETRRDVTYLDPAPTKGHNPSQKTLLKQTNATLAVKNGAAYTAGTYIWQYTCSVCGEMWEETESFNPGILYYIKPAADKHSNDALTTPYYQYGSSWNQNYYTPHHIIQPGTTLYFLTQSGVNENIPGNSHLIQTTDADVIANGTWNIKIEYPVGGTPVMTLNNATIINGAGIWWGYAIHQNTAPLTIVLKGENYIAQTRYTNGGILNFRTKADVTITGSGTLNMVANGNGAAIRSSSGNIIFDNANIYLQNYSSSSAHHAIQAEAGSIIFDGGNFTMVGKNATTDFLSGVYTKGDIIVKGGANISMTGSMSSADYSMFHAEGNVVISESTVKLATTYNGVAIRYGGTFTLEYTNGFTAHTAQEATTILEDGTYSYPVDFATDTTYAKLVNRLARAYFDIAPDKALAKFTGTAVTIKDDLDVSFKLDADKVDTKGTVKFTVNGEDKIYNLSEVGVVEGADYVITLPGLSAKEMCTEIAVTIYDAKGNPVSETKTDSVLAYALRLLRNDKFSADTAANNAMKTFVVDMLIYGGMAQVQFGVEGALPTAALNGVEWGYATAADPESDKAPATVTGNGYIGTTFELKSNIGMFIALDATVLTDVASAKVTFTDYLGNAKEFTAEKDATSNEQFTVFAFNELAAANGRQDITWTFYNAENEVVLTVVDSLANYVGRARGAYPYTDELLKYCDSAKAYFTLVNAY